jgi:soluble lytic murein transglycosylase-like protein
MTLLLKAGGVFVGGFLALGGVNAVFHMVGYADVAAGVSEEITTDAPGKNVKAGIVPSQYKALIDKWGNKCSAITPAILAAQINQESGWNPKAGSSAGAQGIAQFIPGTWKAHGLDANHDGKASVWDPEDALPSAAQYMCDLARYVKNVPGDRTVNALAAYNAGANKVLSYKGVPPYVETMNYVNSITSAAKRYEE